MSNCRLSNGSLGVDFLTDSEEEAEDMTAKLLQESYDSGSDEIIAKGKKNIEQIAAYLNVLGTRINVDYELAPEGEYFPG